MATSRLEESQYQDTPLISIITPAYNHEAFIGSCIESVLRQTYSNWEQIIIDDGSTDKTADVIRGYSDRRIRFIQQANHGIEALALTYNEALSQAKGEIVAILEGDDVWPPDKLSAQVPAFADERIVLAYGVVRECAADGTLNNNLSRSVRKRSKLPKTILLNCPVGSATRYMLRADSIDLLPESTVLIRRSSLESIGGFQCVQGLCVASFPTFLKLGLVGPFHYAPVTLGYRRRHPSSASLLYFDRLMDEAERHAFRFIEQHHRDLNLSDIEKRRIATSWRRTKYQRHFTAGRLLLTQGQWQSARRRFGHALNPLLPRIFVASAAGWILAAFHCDLEKIMGLFGKTRLIADAKRPGS
jgi:glycosyltransferase involved in cell wall biosynthesis